jgi:hypothetical protein
VQQVFVFPEVTSLNAAQCCGQWVSEARDAAESVAAPLWRHKSSVAAGMWHATVKKLRFVGSFFSPSTLSDNGHPRTRDILGAAYSGPISGRNSSRSNNVSDQSVPIGFTFNYDTRLGGKD